MHPLIRPVEAILPRASRQFGMKARNLAALARAGFPVPAAYVISCEATDRFLHEVLAPEQRLEALVSGPQPDAALLARIRERIVAGELAGDLLEAMRSVFAELRLAGAQAVVVRPSRIITEGMEPAVAGLHESSLGLTSVQALVQAAQRCWASLFTPAAIHCARTLGEDASSTLALVVQAMVPAEAAGTLWTVNPLTNDVSEMTLDAVFGLGSGLRDASNTADLYQIDRRTGWIRDRVVGSKQRAFQVDEQGHLGSRVVAPDMQQHEVLDEHTLRQMVDLGRRIEAHFGEPREIEWAVIADAVYVLQARPIAARPGMIRLPSVRRGRDEPDQAAVQWLSLGAVECLSDVATPLTWSAVNTFCREGMPRALSALGLDDGRELNGVRSQRGRPYLDVADLANLGVGFDPLLDGVSQLPQSAAVERVTPRDIMKLPVTLMQQGRRRQQASKRLDALESLFVAERARLLSIDPRILSGVALADTLFDAQRLVDRLMRQLLVSTATAMGSWGLLRRVVGTVLAERARAIELGLLSNIEALHGHDGVAGLEPLIAVCRDPRVRESLPATSLADLSFAALNGHPLQATLATYLSEHGHRAYQDLELASPRWMERPGVVVAMACSPLAQHGPSAPSRRRAAEDEHQRALHELARRWGEPLVKPIEALAHVVRRDIAERERVRLWCQQALQLVRRCVVDGSRRLGARETMVRDDAAFLLSLDELRSYLRGEIRAVAQLVALRRSLQRQIEALPSPPDAFVGYPQPVAAATQWASLRGTAIAPGVAEGPARWVRSVSDLERLVPGDVVVLRHLEPAWAPLICRAAGVVAELGSPLHPGAVTLRQYAVPSVSQLGVSLRAVRDGEQVRVDADSGVLSRKSGA